VYEVGSIVTIRIVFFIARLIWELSHFYAFSARSAFEHNVKQ